MAVSFEQWRYYLIPANTFSGDMLSKLLALAPNVEWPDKGIRWSNDHSFALLCVPPGDYPEWAEALVASFLVQGGQQEALEITKQPEWQQVEEP